MRGFKLSSFSGLFLLLVSVILEPYFDLSWRQVDHPSELLSFRGRQVPLISKPSFQLVDLLFGEEDAAFPFLGSFTRFVSVDFRSLL